MLTVIECDDILSCFHKSSLEEMGPDNVGLESSFQTSEEALVKFIVFFMVEGLRLVG